MTRKNGKIQISIPATTRLVLPSDPDEQNDERSSWVGAALLGFVSRTGQRPGADGWHQIVKDFVCDLGHFCDRAGVDLSACIEAARDHYRAETDNQGRQL